ncbi:MAG: NAD(+)/NADH kinase, partial [Coriobacteriia bacterium]|nr:NAD(+)/NADH kinase [Coriobacteriia bacterium]
MRILLVSNLTKQSAVEAMQAAAVWLTEQQIEHNQIYSENLTTGDLELEYWQNQISQYDCVFCFGGDGTILRVSKMIGNSGTPLLAFNFGGMGFLAGAQPENMIDALSAAIQGRLTSTERTMIDVEILFSDGETLRLCALNETVVSRLDAGRIVSLNMFI